MGFVRVGHWPLVRFAVLFYLGVAVDTYFTYTALRCVCVCVCDRSDIKLSMCELRVWLYKRMSWPEIVSQRPNILPLPPYDSTTGFPSHLCGKLKALVAALFHRSDIWFPVSLIH